MPPTISSLFMLLILCSSLLYHCSARESINTNNSISDNRGETLVSAGKIFELGFFTPNESLSIKARYVGIWYYNFPAQTVVWVANRNQPLSDRNGLFTLTRHGNLVVLDGKRNVKWSTDLDSSSSSKNITVELLDSGNLVLSNDISGKEYIVWESFNDPTDTFLPGMLMDQNINLTSWTSRDNPAQGSFRFRQTGKETDPQYITWKDGLMQYWNSETDQMPYSLVNLLSNTSTYFNTSAALIPTTVPCSKRGAYSNCLPSGTNNPYQRRASPITDDSYKRVVMSYTGEIQYLRYDDNKNWSIIWWAPRDRCGALNFCGKFGSCNINKQLVCKCLPGFEPSSPDNWKLGDFSGGCIRKSQICGKSGEKDTFLSLRMMKVREPDTQFEAANENECRNQHCLGNCKCLAYSYDNSTATAVCWIWTEDLTNLQEEYADGDGGRNLSVRVDISDIESTVRNCETCGTNMIPYPLSTGPKCGDPMYFSFQCNTSSGQVSFKSANLTYRVTNINPNTRKFIIQAKDVGNCEAGNSTRKILQLNPLLPFHVNNSCTADSGNFSSGISFKSRDEVEIYWDLPPEPTCTSSADCKDWPNSTCNSTQDGNKRCLCNANFRWYGSILNCTREQSSHGTKKNDGPSRTKIPKSPIIVVTIIALIVLLCTIICLSYLRRRREEERRQNQMQHLYDSERRIKDLIDSHQFREEDKNKIDVPFFDLKTILVATDNFSDANKLGKGGFGPVYKGTFSGGREIAVKRLSNVSGQGLEEFKNEVILIAKLQHRNLVRLLGYCIKGEEKLLLYEYMPNKSLDSFIFDRTLCVLLDWKLRFDIILGIARGLLYLHQDSRLRIIHRDLKTSNILLDKEMTPKISDFGLARIFEGKQTEANTNKVVGTYGYMSPEYANYGFFSVKSDVFSFGVVVLEIISGKKVIGFYESEQALSLLGYAWRLWNENRALDLMDQRLCQTCSTNEFLKCANIGLLCVQEDPIDRPTMSNVVAMLDCETVSLSTPKQPAFIGRRDPSSTTSASSKPEVCSNNEMTITVEDGR